MRTIIFDSREQIYKHETYQVVLPGEDGEFSVRDFHQPFLFKLRKGKIKIKENESDEEHRIFSFKDGLARFKGNELLILCET